MEQLRSLILSIGLEELINCTLIVKNVRNAMLIQPADYNEATSKDKITSGKLEGIKKAFPELIISDFDGEILISKKPYLSANIKKNSDMGTILGYPCANTFDRLDPKKEVTYGISIDVNLNPGGNTDKVQILAYVCPDDSTFAESNVFAKKCEEVLKADPLLGRIVKSVESVLSKSMPITYLINKLIKNIEIDSDDDYNIRNHIWNLGVDESGISDYKYKYDNPVHRGILIGLLTLCENNPIEPFFPLQQHAEHKAVDKVTSKWANELFRVFKETEAKKGGKTRKSKC